MSANWYYKSTSPTCEGISGGDGIASCSRQIGMASKGYAVRVTVRFDYQGKIYSASTEFTPR